jgi:hypothetical protein
MYSMQWYAICLYPFGELGLHLRLLKHDRTLSDLVRKVELADVKIFGQNKLASILGRTISLERLQEHIPSTTVYTGRAQ